MNRWNGIMAAVVCSVNDAPGMRGEAPIRELPDFEHVEAEGQKVLRDLKKK